MTGRIPTVVVATLGASFGVALLQLSGALAAAVRGDAAAARHDSTEGLLILVSFVFTAIAVYVSGVVTANTVATVVAGRARQIALLRLLGSSARAERVRIAREGLSAGVLGAILGTAIGTGAVVGIVTAAVAFDWLPAPDYSYLQPIVVVPPLAVTATTWLAAWVGSRRVLTVTPLQALGSAEGLSREEAVRRPARNAAAIALMAIGVLLLLGGVAIGLVSPLGVLVGLIGGILSFSGLVLGAHLVMPPALRLVGRTLGRSVPSRLAAENALRHPERSSRTTIGLVIGVTLVTMFAVAIASFRALADAARVAQPGTYAGIGPILDALTATFSVLVGFSALIAAVGLINTLSLSVLQRRRELGLLRAVGLGIRQLRAMILAESAQLTVTSVLLGLLLGTFYGWCGAQSLLGSSSGVPGIVAPGVPWATLAATAIAAAALAVIAAVAPTRRATRVPPVEALAVE